MPGRSIREVRARGQFECSEGVCTILPPSLVAALCCAVATLPAGRDGWWMLLFDGSMPSEVRCRMWPDDREPRDKSMLRGQCWRPGQAMLQGSNAWPRNLLQGYADAVTCETARLPLTIAIPLAAITAHHRHSSPAPRYSRVCVLYQIDNLARAKTCLTLADRHNRPP